MRDQEKVDPPLTVSCVIPARNAESDIRRAIESVLGQSYPVTEIIVVDDGSQDGTAEVARQVGGPVIVLSQEADGPALARNRGIQAARGSVVAFLDADDTWALTKTARQVALLTEHSHVHLCFCNVQAVWPEDGGGMHPQSVVQPPTLMARREVFSHIGLFDASLRYNDSLEWLLRARRAGLVMDTVPEALYLRRMHGANMSRLEAEEARAELLRLTRRLVHEQREMEDEPTAAGGN